MSSRTQTTEFVHLEISKPRPVTQSVRPTFSTLLAFDSDLEITAQVASYNTAAFLRGRQNYSLGVCSWLKPQRRALQDSSSSAAVPMPSI